MPSLGRRPCLSSHTRVLLAAATQGLFREKREERGKFLHLGGASSLKAEMEGGAAATAKRTAGRAGVLQMKRLQAFAGQVERVGSET